MTRIVPPQTREQKELTLRHILLEELQDEASKQAQLMAKVVVEMEKVFPEKKQLC
ncbi:hypothetical protein TIFTF001_015275 [Ficus carica]|uniref:Uncharacterized protein n=1 Tax=Ficus carica TaxID=3494 RepID=A0AA88AL97_FICCA|nr:hypothetical protein TIFTF001_015275 [Ficus carica]